ncbi:MAG: hypothetical protein UX86_C0002G0016 [Candidatus Amesbacteria bacterium GW2011_GWC1_47_15]|uniref:FemAB family protein n=1 Tax=Candidatus Amesbacteria bacterium GW2011_GWC1_47_15 TaxID=1618364 RepID=A0A0G1V515_9BACT|nr:MAG: hypothetical protein UX86_C0002G0016 [Candidatus Amesbacteria bacterium GW2011_GWC1_47_15]
MNQEEWNSQVNHPLQSWEWGEFRSKRQQVDRQDGMQVIWTKVPFLAFKFGYVPMGKVPSDEEIKRLSDLGRKRRAIGIRMEPNAPKDSGFVKLKPGRNLFKTKTFIIDLTRSEEELLKNMHPKGRYNIKVAKKHGVQISENSSSSGLNSYLDLMFGGTARRQKIYAHSENYHKQMWETLQPAGMAHLFTAEYQGKIIAAAMIFTFKDTAYYAYGASALEHKEVMAPTLLLWETVRWSKLRDLKQFDLWGAEEGKGFSRFKEQFGGQLTELAGTYDLPINPLLYPLFRLSEEIRWKLLRILK